MEAQASKSIQVVPQGNYLVDWGSFKGNLSTWVRLTKIDANKGVLKYRADFSASGIPDGSEVDATLVFRATADGIAVNDTVRLSAVVESTPSLDKSRTQMPSKIVEGQEAS